MLQFLQFVIHRANGALQILSMQTPLLLCEKKEPPSEISNHCVKEEGNGPIEHAESGASRLEVFGDSYANLLFVNTTTGPLCLSDK